MKAIYGLYSSPEAAEKALGGLRDNASELGITRRSVIVQSSEPLEEYDLGWHEQATPMPWLAAAGGVVGATGGYLLAAFTQRVYPLPTGNMPIVALWPTGVIVYELTMLCAILTTLVTLLVSARLPNVLRKVYDPEVTDGKILIGVVNPREESSVQIENALREAGATKLKQFP